MKPKVKHRGVLLWLYDLSFSVSTSVGISFAFFSFWEREGVGLAIFSGSFLSMYEEDSLLKRGWLMRLDWLQRK